MRRLEFWGNRLTDFSFLEDLPRLTTLGLARNQLTTLTLPEGLNNLTELNLYRNELTSLTLPEGLSSLVMLDLSDNPLTTMEVPAGFDLESLDLRGFAKSEVTFYIPIRVALVDNKIEVTWTQGVLQSSDALAGFWSGLADAVSPYQVEPTGPQQFFRVKPE